MGNQAQGWRDALGDVAEALASARDPWWIIGSAAVALHGEDPGTVNDIDVIISPRDFDRLEAARILKPVKHRTRDHFNSEKFGRSRVGEYEVEYFADLRVLADGEWHLVEFDEAEIVDCQGVELRVPARAELIDLLQLFGREKDLRRAACLRKI